MFGAWTVCKTHKEKKDRFDTLVVLLNLDYFGSQRAKHWPCVACYKYLYHINSQGLRYTALRQLSKHFQCPLVCIVVFVVVSQKGYGS